MKKELAMWLIIAVLVVGTLFSTQKADIMAIDFNGTTGNITFHPLTTAANNLTTMTVTAWINPDTLDSDIGLAYYYYGTGLGTTNDGTYPNKVYIQWATSDTAGIWVSSDNSISTGSPILIAFSLDRTNVANDPIIYINGASVSVTEAVTPTGTRLDETDDLQSFIGSNFDGKIHDVRVYNRILTPAEVLAIYNARGRDNIHNGLVFCPFLKGAAGLQAFDGATLAAGNTIVDPCSGAYGVPAGSPVGVGETYLR